MSSLILVGGGVRSGKSTFALARARALGPRRAFLATAHALDDEMRSRVLAHVKERGTAFRTIEAPFDLADAIAALSDVDVAVVDCLTHWLSNLLTRGDDDGHIESSVAFLLRALDTCHFPVVIVTNEVGMGVVPESALGRRFRDIVGRTHQLVAARASEIYFAAMGCIIRLRPPPVALEDAGVA
ncbi:MAG TPA: bifunctional adenosylcobinamide kinase/adenosylcobinamide-phosphate guanylyltransferase [Polyangiaceae bacterium]|jgi:adenosylcobinamide kinase/adenosylcobinamide-phosphate guanylyltransferase|nr:bifunctional adenosylcobinamide kinase/adenosylcobinamide-phosphate guanylyltransferase [Polyangiaceae bacterium]